MEVGKAITNRILNLCQEHGLSINKLCILSGITQSTVNNIVNGRNHSTTVSTIQKLCDGLGIKVREFFDDPLFENLEQAIK